MRNNWPDVAARGLTAFIIGLWAFGTVVVALLVVFSEYERWAPEIRLALVLVGTMIVVISASAATAWVYSRLSSNGDSGQVLRESVVRFSWLAAPIAGGYGMARLVESLGSIFASSPPSP